MSDILNIAKFDAGIQTPLGLKQFSMTDAAGELIINREYKESFDKFKSGCTCGDSYIWRVLSAVADQTGLILYDNVKNYIDYVTNVDVCKVQSLRSMVKMYGFEYKVFDRLDLLPIEVLDLINIFSINKKHLIYGEKLLEKYRDTLLAEGVLSNYLGIQLADSQTSAVLSSTVLNCDCLDGGQYRNFMVDSFESVLSGFLSLPYSEGGVPIYSIEDEWGIYEELARRRDKYALQYVEGTVEYDRRQYKMLNGVSLRFDECATLDRIEAGLELESDYQGFELKLIQMERELRQKSQSGDKTSRYAFYKKQRVLEYANFITDKYFSDHKCSDLSVYKYDNQYFEVIFESKGSAEDPGQMYEKSGRNVIYRDPASENLQIDSAMVHSVAESLADTSLYISRIREKIKLQTRKNYMKGTYDLMLYVINEFLVDYSRLNPIFRDDSKLSNATSSVSQLLWPIYQDLSSHDINNLTAIEYFDETEYYNISAATDEAGHDGRYSSSGVNDRFWHYPAGEQLMQHDGIDSDFDIESIKSFYMDTLGIRDNYISDDNALCAFLDAVFNLGAVESFIHSISADVDGKESAHELFGTQVEKYGHYSDDLYMGYLGVKRAWQTFSSYLSGNEYEYQVSDCVSAQVLSVADYIKQLILERELSAVSAVYDTYIDRVDQLSILVDQGIESYNDLISGEYTFYFKKQDSYKYCLEDFSDPNSYKHHWYINSTYDAGLEYWYDMIQAINEYALGSDDYGEHITNWPIRDTIEYFYSEFKKLSGWYVDMTTSVAVPGIGMDITHDWSQEYGFVDISAVSLEDELKYGYNFIQEKIQERREYITNILNSLKQQAIQMQNLSQSIKNALTQALASYDDQRGNSKLGDSSVWCVSLNEYDNGYPSDGYKTYETSRCKRQEDKPGTVYNFAVEQRVGTKKLWYFCAAPNDNNEYKTGNYAFSEQFITPYNKDDDILSRCAAIKAYMQAPTSFILVKEKSDDLKWYDETLNYDMMDEGVFASISQVEADYANLTNQVDGIINQLEKLGYTFSKDEDIDTTITNLIDFINTEVDEDAIGNDEKIQVYKKYFRAIIQLSSLYIPIKYEYDSISKDQNQRAYLSEFTPDNDMTLAALDRLSAYSVNKDLENREAILGSISQMQQKYDETLSTYQNIAEQLAQEYMLPQSFQPYVGYIEEMVLLMYEALRNDIDEKIWYAHSIADAEYLDKIAPAASELIARLAQYVNSVYPLPDAINKRLRELYYFDEPSYIRQKEMFLTYGGRSFCYYPYYNFKNVVHSSYQVHPFLWNFIRRESASNVVRKTFYSVNVDELERANIAQNWRKFFGDYGESKYLDLSKPRYPDYSGYQSRYEDSNHVADNTQFVSEVVDYDGAFYPPAVEWLRANGITKAISSIQDTKYNKKIAEELQTAILDLSSLEWNIVLSTLSSATSAYCTQAQVDSLISYVYEQPNCYNSGKHVLSDITPYDVYSAVMDALSGESTFYGRFYRQLRLDQVQQRANKEYIINQLSSYWGHIPVPGGGPSISAITNATTLDRAFDIYKYGIDSYGNMYCLYKQYDSDIVLDTVVRGGLSYKYKQSTPGSLWIRLKNHPLAFPAFSGRYPNVYMETTSKRHVAFANLLNLRRWNTEDEKDDDIIGDDIYTKLSVDGAAQAASCIYDFEFTKNRNDVTFVTKMHSYDLTCDSKDIQCYQNSWLVHCRPEQEVLSSENGPGRTVLKLYSPAGETDYYWSGEDYRSYSALSVLSALDGDGVTLYQYIGSYLKGDSGIYHAYAMQHVYRGQPNDGRYITLSDSVSCIVRDVIDKIKIYPSINGKYKDGFTITGRLVEGGDLSVTGSDICLAYDEENNIVNFAAQTVLAPSSAIRADVGLIGLSSNAKGATIDDPSGDEMNSHDIFDTNVTFFRKQVVSYRLRDVRSSGNAKYEFNTNADMSYFPVYPGFAGAKKLYTRPQYEHYNVELLGMAKDISQQISYVNPQPDPYLDADTILSNFANARVYQDYTGYIDETFKTVDNKLIGVNSDALSPGWVVKTVKDQQVVCKDDFMVWQIGLDKLYQNFDISNAMKLKVLLFNRKCYGKNPYMFADISALANGWVDLNYDPVGDNFDGYSVISAADCIFGYGNRVLAQSTLDGIDTTAIGDSNHIYNIKSVQARLVIDDVGSAMTLEIRFSIDDIRMAQYTYVPTGDLQAVFLDVRNLDVFNYFHYLDTYGALRFLDFFKTQEYLNRFLTKHGEGYTIYYRGHEFTEEELLNRLRSYYEYMNQMVPLSSVDLSQYDCLSDVYILQGSRKLQFKVDEDFRYELDHPGYFYPTVNAKFPMNPAQYAMQMTSFKENAASDMLVGLFGQNNLFLLDMEDPAATLDNMGRIDIPILLDDQEYIFAYEEYMNYAEGELSTRRNCDLYDASDPQVLQFVQFESDSAASHGVPANIAQTHQAFVIPDSQISAVSMEMALVRVSDYTASDAYGVDGVYPIFAESGGNGYVQEYIGFTLDGGSFSREQVEQLSRIYVNYRKCEDGGLGIQLYFNYMNYLNSPYLRVQDGRVYVDLVDNTYLSLKPDEDGVLDIVTQFRYYKGGTLCGYRNVKLASYQIYNISDDKPKFLIKNIDRLERDGGSNKTVQPRAAVSICDVDLDAESPGGEGSKMDFDLMFDIETSAPLKQIEFYVDYPSDFMKFTSMVGDGWSLNNDQPGYAKLTVDASTRFISIPARTMHTKGELADMGDQTVMVYIDEPVIVGENGLYADLTTTAGRINVFVSQVTGRLDVLLTDSYSSQPTVNVFNTEYSRSSVKGFILAK